MLGPEDGMAMSAKQFIRVIVIFLSSHGLEDLTIFQIPDRRIFAVAIKTLVGKCVATPINTK